MGKTNSTFLYYFLIPFITSFSPKHFICALKKKIVHNSVVPIQKWNFLTLPFRSLLQSSVGGERLTALPTNQETGTRHTKTNFCFVCVCVCVCVCLCVGVLTIARRSCVCLPCSLLTHLTRRDTFRCLILFAFSFCSRTAAVTQCCSALQTPLCANLTQAFQNQTTLSRCTP